MRNVIAGVVAVAVLLAVGIGAYRMLSSRLDASDDLTPEMVAASFAEALSSGDAAELDELSWSSTDDLVAARSALFDAIGTGTLAVEVLELREPEPGRAEADLVVTATGESLPGEAAWGSMLDLQRRRGRWRVVASAASLHPQLRANWTFSVDADEPLRAPILDHLGEALTGSGEVHIIGIAPGEVRDPERLRTTWANLLPESLQDLVDLLARTDTNPGWFYPVVTIDDERFEEVWTRLRAVPGVHGRDGLGTSRAESGFARHVLGRVGEPTREQAEELGLDLDQPLPDVGLYGLERVFEQRLTGAPPVRLLIVEEDGDIHSEAATVAADDTGPVTTTLETAVQEAVENAMVGAPTSAIVVVDVASGAIRASASRPLSGYNRAWEGRYPPGDAFAPVVAVGSLLTGIGVQDEVTCPLEDVVVGARLNAPREVGDTTVASALGAGCDTTVGALASRMDDGQLKLAASLLGFDREYTLELPSFGGAYPLPTDETERVRAATGQGRVLASPLHLASVVAAADGTWDPPHVLPDEAGDPIEVADGAATYLGAVLRAGSLPGGSAARLGRTGAHALAGTGVHSTGATISINGWVVGVIDDLAFCVLVEDADAPGPALDLAERFLNELAQLR